MKIIKILDDKDLTTGVHNIQNVDLAYAFGFLYRPFRSTYVSNYSVIQYIRNIQIRNVQERRGREER